jgi:cation diffusion facilitator family transporter
VGEGITLSDTGLEGKTTRLAIDFHWKGLMPTAAATADSANASNNIKDAKVAAIAGIAGSGALALIKLAAGIAGHSHGVLADGIESAGDALASGVVLFGLKVSLLPPDLEHPYGHGRAEGIAGKTVATMMLVSGMLLLWANASELITLIETPKAVRFPAAWTIWPAIVSVFVKTGMFSYKLKVGRRVGSMGLEADAWNDFADILSAIMVIVGVVFALHGYVWADHLAAVAVALLIVITSLRVFRDTTVALLDQQAPPEFLADLRALAQSVPGVAGVEKLLARRAGLNYFVDMHLEVDGVMTVHEAHAVSHRVKELIKSKRGDIADVLIHI